MTGGDEKMKEEKEASEDKKKEEEEEDDGEDDAEEKETKGDEGGDDDGEESGEEKKNVRRDRRSRERRRRDRDRKRREEKKAQESGGKSREVADDSLLDKYEPAEVMEVYSWPMPLPEDAGRVRAYGIPGQVHEFWEYYEDYFKPVKDEALKMVLAEPDLDHDPCFRMPQLGQHYAQKKGNWEREQEQEQLREWDAEMFGADDNDEESYLQKTVVTSSGRVVGGKRKQADPPLAPPGGWGIETPTADGQAGSTLLRSKMAMRMLACFIQQDGVPSKHEEAAVALQAAAIAALQDGPDLLSFSIDQRIRTECTNLGLMESPDAEYDSPQSREDDQICAELRYQQRALRQHVIQREQSQTASRKALKVRLQDQMPWERILAEVHAAARNLEQLLQPKFKLTKGVKPLDIKRAVDQWDKALTQYKAYQANPNKRKPGGPVGMPPQTAQQAAVARMHQMQTQAQPRPGQPRSNPGQFGQRPQPGQVSAALKPMPPGLQFVQQPQVPQQQPGAPSAGMAHQLSQFHQSIRGKR